jgi:hypothetical protein
MLYKIKNKCNTLLTNTQGGAQMKKAGLVLFLLLVSILISGKKEVQAITVYDLTVTFNYDPDSQPKPVYGYKLYVDGKLIVTWDNPYLFSRDLVIALPETTPSCFTMTTVTTDGDESLHSEPCYYTPSTQSRPATPAQFMRISSIFGKYFNASTDKIRIGNLTLPVG